MQVETQKQRELVQELNKLSKRANQRILSIERLTKRKSPAFAVQELADYLSEVNGLTKRKGRSIRASMYKKSMTETEVVGSIKALQNFLSAETSTLRGIKKYKTSMEKIAGKKLSFSQASTIFHGDKQMQWVIDKTPGSDFWTYYNLDFKKEKPDFDTFITELETMWQEEVPIDESYKPKLKQIYYYLMKDK